MVVNRKEKLKRTKKVDKRKLKRTGNKMTIRNIALALMLTAATALPHLAQAQDKPHHSDGMSDYLRFAPWVATYTLKHVVPVVMVAAHAVHSHGCGDGISCHAYPRRHIPVFFVEHGCTRKSHGGVARWKRLVVGAVGALLVDGLLQRVRHANGETHGEGRVDHAALRWHVGTDGQSLSVVVEL